MRGNHILSLAVALCLILPSIPLGTAFGGTLPGIVDPVEDTLCSQAVIDCSNLSSFDGLCDHHAKVCEVPGETPELPAYPMAGWALAPLRPLMPDETYQILYQLLGGDDKEPPEPLPSPWDLIPAKVEVEREVSGGARGASIALYTAFELALLGITVKGETKTEASVTIGPGNPPAEPGQVPCLDPAGCPDLIVDASKLRQGGIFAQNFSPTHCAVQEGATEPGLRRLLRFTFTTPNIGEGDLIVGSPADMQQWFEWGACHGHWHFVEYADYRLWTVEAYAKWTEAREADPDARPDEVLAENPELAAGFVAGHKQGFCVIDIVRYLPLNPSPKYYNCATNQGIQVGWADEYHFGLDGQWVDVTDVASGLYVLEAEVNPERLFQETDYSNNRAAIFVVV